MERCMSFNSGSDGSTYSRVSNQDDWKFQDWTEISFYFRKKTSIVFLKVDRWVALISTSNKKLPAKCFHVKFQIFLHRTIDFIQPFECVLPTQIAHFKNLRGKSIAVHHNEGLSEMLLSLNYFTDFHWLFFRQRTEEIFTQYFSSPDISFDCTLKSHLDIIGITIIFRLRSIFT